MIEHMQPTDERAFEKSIEQTLVGSTHENREAQGLTDIDQQCPTPDQYYWGCPADFDKKTHWTYAAYDTSLTSLSRTY